MNLFLLLLIFVIMPLLIFAAIFLLIAVSLFIITDFTGAPFVPSKKEKIKTMLELADIKSGEIVYDLGSGDGALIFEAALYGTRAVGIEINPFLVLYSRFLAGRTGLKNMVAIKWMDFRKFSLNNADVVFLYLWPDTNAKLREKLERELKKSARIISNSFPIKGWTPLQEKNNVFLYLNPRACSETPDML